MAPPWTFIASYIGTALWFSMNDRGDPLDRYYDISDLAPKTRERMEADCHAFYGANDRHIPCLGAPIVRDFDGPVRDREAAMAGHDFWLTRCGHGAGFRDGDWPKQVSRAGSAIVFHHPGRSVSRTGGLSGSPGNSLRSRGRYPGEDGCHPDYDVARP